MKKRLLAAMEARDCGRSHAEFKEVFSVANKGVSFALVSSKRRMTLLWKADGDLRTAEAYHRQNSA